MRRNERFQAGFTLALSIMVTAVVVMLAAGLMLRILNDVKGAKISSQSAMLGGDTDVALNLAEAEIFQDIELLHSAVWATATRDLQTNGDCVSPSSTCVPSDCPGPSASCATVDNTAKFFPLRQLQLLGNARNWPAFADWEHYVTDPAYRPADYTVSGYVSANPCRATGSTWVRPAKRWDPMDRTLTRGWWRLPRNDAVDNDYYDFNAVSNPEEVFPSAIAGDKTTRVANTSYRKDSSVTAVTHNYFYQELLPIRGEKIPANRIPTGSVWDNAEDEYGNGNGETIAGPISDVTRYVWDTPFYKKIYRLQNNRKVAIYCRLDLRDYFKPDPGAAAKDRWAQPDPTNGARSKDNFLKFFLAAIPEGRLDQIPGENKQAYYGSEIKTKYILIKTGGMENADLRSVNYAPDAYGQQTEDRQYPPVMLVSGGTLRGAQDASAGFGQDIRGMVFRADGNRGFNWSTLSTRSTPITESVVSDPNVWTPIASERYVYLFERVTEFATPTYFIWAQYPHSAVNQDRRGPNDIDTSQMYFRRTRMDQIGEWNSFQEPASPSQKDATVSIQATFSAFADRFGKFEISAASGWPGDCNNYVGGNCLSSKVDSYGGKNIDLFWRGPVAGRTYWTTQFPAENKRQGLPFQATPSIKSGVSNMR